MEHGSMAMIAILVICGFLAGVIDSVVGGGGLIAIPALLSAGIPLPLLLGSNKLAGTLCSFTSTCWVLNLSLPRAMPRCLISPAILQVF